MFVVLTAGREIPVAEAVRQRGKGVAIVLSGPAVSTWRAGGNKWNAWSSRLAIATLEVRDGRSGLLHVLSCHDSTCRCQ